MSLDITSKALLLETIKIEDGVIINLPYHQARFSHSSKALHHTTNTVELKSHIVPPKKGLYRCRILYTDKIHSIEYIPYTPQEISSLKIVTSDIDYTYKYANRNALNVLVKNEKDSDDILIEKDGYLTDTSIANIAFYDGTKWLTPQTPLLKGTFRQKLIDEGFLHTRKIKPDEISNFTQVALINAMIGFKILKNIRITDNEGKHYDY